MTENQTVWESDIQGVKEEIFIQTGRRGRDGQPRGEDAQQGGGWWTADWLVPQSCADKLWSETDCETQSYALGEKASNL